MDKVYGYIAIKQLYKVESRTIIIKRIKIRIIRKRKRIKIIIRIIIIEIVFEPISRRNRLQTDGAHPEENEGTFNH